MGGMELSSHYDLSLVALSVAIAIMAAYVAIDLAGRVTASQGRARFLWLAMGAAAMGTGIWSMHFIGMLAFILPTPVTYYVPTVVLSLSAAIAASLVALFVVSGRGLRWQRLLSGGVLMGAAIVMMHYTGMAAMRLEAVTRYDPLLWTLSAAIAVGVSFVGLTLVYRLREETASGWNWRKVAAAVVMGLAIPSMHYTGMAAAGFTPNAEAPLDLSYTVDITSLGGTAITIGTFFLLGIALAWPKGSASRPYAALPAIMLIMIVLALSIGAVALYYVEDRLVDYAGDSLLVAAADIADKLDRTLAERYGDTLMLAKAFAFFAHDPARMTEYLNWMRHAYPVYQWMGVVDAQGRIVAATDPASMGRDRSDREWFRTVRDEGGIHVRDVQASEDSGGVLAIAFTAPITGPRGEFLGAVTTRVGLPVLEDIFDTTTRTLQTYWGTRATIEHQFLSRDGDLIVDSGLRQEKKVNLKLLGLPSALLVGSDQPGHVEERHLRRNVLVVTGYAQARGYEEFQGFHWGVLIRMDRSDILTPIHLVLWKLGTAGALVLVPLLGFLLWSTRRLRIKWRQATASESKYCALLESTGAGLYGLDLDGRCVFINKTGNVLLGYAPEELLGKPMHSLIHHTRQNGSPYQVEDCPSYQALRTGQGRWASDEVLWRRDGATFHAEFSSLPIVESGAITGVVVAFTDITERKRIEDQLKQAKDTADAANVAKSEFLASMSHEIRTPMNAIIGMADLLAETPLSEEQRRYVQIFHRAGDNLLDLLNDILDLSKVEASQLELDRRGFDLNDLVEKVTEMLALRAHEKCLELICSIAPGTPTLLIGDPMRLRQVLVNLLSNAIKFTESGEVVLRVAVAEGERQGAMGEREEPILASGPAPRASSLTLRFSVSDSGIGIPPDKLDAIFERFTQVDSSTTRKYGGAGLGLAITKRLVELMGGRIWAESTLGFGSVFYFIARLDVQPAIQRSPNFKPVKLPGLRALVVDDNETNRLILHELLSSWDAMVAEAATGESALAELQRAQAAAEPYELVLLDCRMPEMDGFQVAEAIRKTPSLAGVTMMMLTSDDRKENIQRAGELGLAGYVVKPIRKTELLEAVAAALANRKRAASPAPVDAMPEAVVEAQRALHILLAEDSSDNRVLVETYLKKTPHQLEIADNGAIAVAKYRARKYDLVLMDMQMPVMDGYAAARAIRQWEHEQGRPPVPIIALTAHALQGDEEKSLAAGCTAHLTKPIRRATLLAAITEHAKEAEPAEENGNATRQDTIVVRVDPDLVNLIPGFLDNRRKDITAMQAALEQGDFETIRVLGHSMKGAGGGYGFDAITDIGAALEQAAKARNPGDVHRGLSDLSAYLGRVEVVHD